MATNPAIDCNWGKAQVGDLLPLPSPFKFGETLAKLTKIYKGAKGATFHTYDLYLFGAWIGTVEAKNSDGKIDWKVTT